MKKRLKNKGNITNILFVLLFVCLFFTYSISAYSPQYLDETKNVRLRWKNNVINVAISSSFSKQIPNVKTDGDVISLIRRSLASWENVADIQFVEVLSDKQSVSPNGVIGDGISLITIAQTPENLLMFSGKTKEIPAKTRVFYNRKGFITEADIVLNPYQQFSTDGSFGTFDLESVITHELGHLLGLDHSTVIGSTMLSHIAKNGIYSMANFTAQTLSDDDIAGIRSIYKVEDSNCCGTISGKILLRNGRNANNFHIWAEESETGKISAGVLTKPDGTFQLEGLSNGKYRLFAQDKNTIAKFSAEEIDEIVLEKGKSVKIEHKLVNNLKNFNLKYIGFNSQLTKQAVPVNQGKSFTIYVGAEKINAEDILVKFNSPFFSVFPNSFVKHDFGDDLNVLSFEVFVSSKAVFGDYSLQIYNKNQESDYFVGSLTIDRFTNIWESKTWLNEE